MARCALAAALVAGVSATSCRHEPTTAPDRPAAAAAQAAEPPSPHEPELVALRSFEQARRTGGDFVALPASDEVLGPEPYRIAAIGHGAIGQGAIGHERLVGVLRNESAVVLLDGDATELARLPAPRSPGGIAVAGDDLLVAGEAARELAQYRVEDHRLTRVATVPIDALGLRDIALAPDARTAYAVEEHDGRLLAIGLERDRHGALHGTGARELARCHGPIRVAVDAGDVAVNCLLDHAIEIHRDGGATARIHHDGPLWSFALHRDPDGSLLIAAAGIEDHPLEREDGGFGYIDSYVYLYRLDPGATEPQRLAAINTSALGVVTSKWLAIRGDAAEIRVTTAGYATADQIALRFRRDDFAAAPAVARTGLVPGTSAAVVTGDDAIAADPLLDAWIVQRGGALRVVPVAGSHPPRPIASRIGEALFFTTLMAPWNSAEGKLSRFTCETCHHEGYVDGRIHYTGRDRVFAATRPLVGLGNLRPYFSRALDKTMADMVHAEFRVANRHNGRDPWFALTRADVPWLEHIPDAPAELSPTFLRQALMTFLMDFRHRPNPAAIDHPIDHATGRAQFTALERAGAQVFRDRCATCHAARLVTDDPASLVPFERWESLVLSPGGPIAWSDASYQKTGVEPYVHPDGARVAPLRRLYKKWPYLTNGSATSLDELLARFAWGPAGAIHGGASTRAAAQHLADADRAALRAFLDLL